MKVWSYHKINRTVDQVGMALLKAKRPASEEEAGKLVKAVIDKFVPDNAVSVVSTKKIPLPRKTIAQYESYEGLNKKIILNLKKIKKSPEKFVSVIKHELTHALQEIKQEATLKRIQISKRFNSLYFNSQLFEDLKYAAEVIPNFALKGATQRRVKSEIEKQLPNASYKKTVAVYKKLLHDCLCETQAYNNELSGAGKLGYFAKRNVINNLKMYKNMADGIKEGLRELVKSHNVEQKALLRGRS